MNATQPSSLGAAASIAVVIPTFQPGEFLLDTLNSIARQTVAPAEVVVVDDGSEPPVNLPPVAAPVRLLRIPHGGIAAARNAGVQATKAPLVHVCDHDDVLEPPFYERQTAAFSDQPPIDIAYSFCGFIDGGGAVIPGRLPWETPTLSRPQETLRRLLQRNELASVATIFRREVFRSLGGFRPLDYVQDWDFWLRAADRGFGFVAIPEILAWHRVHPTQQSNEAQRIPALEESLLMLSSLHVPPRLWLESKRTRGAIHLHLSRILRSERRPGAFQHALYGFGGRPIETARLVFGLLR